MSEEVIATAVAATGSAELSFWETITHSGPLAFATLLLLVLFSVASWAIILWKLLSILKAQQMSGEFLETFWQSKRLDEIFQRSEEMSQSPVAQVFRAGYQELVKVKQREQKQEGGQNPQLLGGAENVERALRRAATAEMAVLGRMIPFLATVGSTSPFIGLFGTVIGIMKAFRDIGAQGSANLATVAPGIAEALIATAAGLGAAIPAVMAFNYFNARLKFLGTEMENFSSDFMNIVRRHFF